MALRKGDRVSLSICASIELVKYESVKSHASVSRELSETIEADLADMEVELRKLILRAFLLELGVKNSLYAALGKDSDIDALMAYCEKELGNVPASIALESEGSGRVQSGQRPGPTKKPVKKA